LFELVQRRARKTRNWGIDCKPERLPKRASRFCAMKPMVSRMNVLEAQAHRLPARRAKCRLGENGKEQAGGAKEELEILRTETNTDPS